MNEPKATNIRRSILDRDVAIIRSCLVAAMTWARRSRRRHHPPGTVGTRQYQEAIHLLTSRMCPSARWRRSVVESFITFVSADGACAIAVGAGEFGPDGSPLEFAGIESGSHRDRAVDKTRDYLEALRQGRLFPPSEPGAQVPRKHVFALMAQDATRMRGELVLGDEATSGRLQIVERVELFHVQGTRAAEEASAETARRAGLPGAASDDVEPEWLDLRVPSTKKPRA
jgi:hypothetical protein